LHGNLSRAAFASVAIGLAVVIGACSSSGTPAPAHAGGASPSAAGASPAGGGTSPAPSAGGGGGTVPSDPCTLLTLADLQTATGLAFAAGAKQSAGTTVECDWFQTGNAGGGGVIVVVSPAGQGHYDTNKASGQAVPGIGDEAYWWDSTNTLYIKRSGLEIEIQVGVNKDASKNATAAKALAPVVLTKL
jgi:hypothetical protein